MYVSPVYEYTTTLNGNIATICTSLVGAYICSPVRTTRDATQHLSLAVSICTAIHQYSTSSIPLQIGMYFIFSQASRRNP